MIIKVQDDQLRDKHLVEFQRLHWRSSTEVELFCDGGGPIPFTILELCPGDRVFIMNSQGQTVDSNRIVMENKE